MKHTPVVTLPRGVSLNWRKEVAPTLRRSFGTVALTVETFEGGQMTLKAIHVVRKSPLRSNPFAFRTLTAHFAYFPSKL